MNTFHQICNQFGKSRLEFLSKATQSGKAIEKWPSPSHYFPFHFGRFWQMTIEYKVNDFESEVGFFSDILGFRIITLSVNYAMFSVPDNTFQISFLRQSSTHSALEMKSFKIEILIERILELTEELKSRGIAFNQNPTKVGIDNHSFINCGFSTPNGLDICLWEQV
ncbi:MAG: hypothetical protein H8E61_00585 [Bacteroidetes bacterium]|nr:hypothetical protein [Bacteroidota bacterium]